MGISRFRRISFAALSLLMFLACSGGGGGESSSSPPAPTANIYLAQSSYDFSGVVIDNSADRIVVIKNTGNANLQIRQIQQPSVPFSILDDACSNATLTSSQTCSVKVRFSPTTQGPFTAALSVPSNDPDLGTVNISLTGVGYGLNTWINQVNSAGCPTISVDLTVTDPQNDTLLNLLTKDNFRLNQNGQLQDITVSAIQYPSPVTFVLTIDASSSTQNVMPLIQAAANSFIDKMTDTDWAAICKFASVVECEPAAAPSFIAGDNAGKSSLKTYINTSFGGAYTVLYDAVFDSIEKTALGTTEKRAVVLLSDGEDLSSTRTLDQVIANAIQKGIPVFTIYYLDPNLPASDGNPLIMQRLAAETGGQYFNADHADLADIFRQISNVLSNKYTITYTSSTCSGTISLDVQAEWGSSYGKDSKTLSLP